MTRGQPSRSETGAAAAVGAVPLGRMDEEFDCISTLRCLITPAFDPRPLQDMFGQEAAVIAAVLATFLDSMRSNLHDLDAAVHSSGFEAIAKVAHRVKGAANMSGALGMALAAVHLEQAARDGDARACQFAGVELDRQWKILQTDTALQAAMDGSLATPGPS